MEREKKYIRLQEKDCLQNEYGPTPCFTEISKHVVCNLCPVQLVTETNVAKIKKMFHNGTCLMDERNSANMGAIARSKKSGKKEGAIPIGFNDSQVLEDWTK